MSRNWVSIYPTLGLRWDDPVSITLTQSDCARRVSTLPIEFAIHESQHARKYFISQLETRQYKPIIGSRVALYRSDSHFESDIFMDGCRMLPQSNYFQFLRMCETNDECKPYQRKNVPHASEQLYSFIANVVRREIQRCECLCKLSRMMVQSPSQSASYSVHSQRVAKMRRSTSANIICFKRKICECLWV